MDVVSWVDLNCSFYTHTTLPVTGIRRSQTARSREYLLFRHMFKANKLTRSIY